MLLFTKLKQFYTKQVFRPTIMGIFLNPFYIIRKGLCKGIVSNKKYMKDRLLDFGCGKKPYKNIFDVKEYVGLDIEKSGHSHENEQIDVYYDGNFIPFENDYFDSVFSSEVLEHIPNLEIILIELFRVTKSSGYLLVTVPFVWDEHEVPYDFTRYTSFGIECLFKKAGFEIIKIEKSTNYVETVFQMWNAYIYQYVFPRNKIIKKILLPFFITPITIIGIVFSEILPENKNFYHNNIVVAKKPSGK